MSLVVTDLIKSYAGGQVPVLTGLSFAVSSGETLVLAGRSGCGKTTALRLIGGLEVPDGGSIKVDDRILVSPENWIPPEKRSVGLVFQHHALFPHLTVRKNIAFGLSGQSRKQQSYRTEELLELVGVRNEADRYPDQISGGQRQRVALARALAPRPSVILLDEPFNNLDPATKRELMDDIKAVLSETAAIVVTHDAEEAVRMGDRIVYLSGGKVLQAGTAEDLYTHPSGLEIAEYLGPVNRIPAVREGRSGWMLFRPEHLSICPLVADSEPGRGFGYCSDFGKNSCCLRGTVTDSRTYGDRRRVVVSLSGIKDGQLLTVHIRPEEKYRVGDRVMVKAPLARMGWADAEAWPPTTAPSEEG